ncbi:MAG TPA: hypothetical protein VF805_02110, partial [Anaeromyxobacteraceae bacterium]
MRRAFSAPLLAVALAVACAHRPPPAPERPDSALAGKNDEELFALGSAAAQAGDDPGAAAAFGRLADGFPSSPRA